MPASSVSRSTTLPSPPTGLFSSVVSRSLLGVQEAPLPRGHGQHNPYFGKESPYSASWFNAREPAFRATKLLLEGLFNTLTSTAFSRFS